jgi:hypothetical protein
LFISASRHFCSNLSLLRIFMGILGASGYKNACNKNPSRHFQRFFCPNSVDHGIQLSTCPYHIATRVPTPTSFHDRHVLPPPPHLYRASPTANHGISSPPHPPQHFKSQTCDRIFFLFRVITSHSDGITIVRGLGPGILGVLFNHFFLGLGNGHTLNGMAKEYDLFLYILNFVWVAPRLFSLCRDEIMYEESCCEELLF